MGASNSKTKAKEKMKKRRNLGLNLGIMQQDTLCFLRSFAFSTGHRFFPTDLETSLATVSPCCSEEHILAATASHCRILERRVLEIGSRRLKVAPFCFPGSSSEISHDCSLSALGSPLNTTEVGAYLVNL